MSAQLACLNSPPFRSGSNPTQQPTANVVSKTGVLFKSRWGHIYCIYFCPSPKYTRTKKHCIKLAHINVANVYIYIVELYIFKYICSIYSIHTVVYMAVNIVYIDPLGQRPDIALMPCRSVKDEAPKFQVEAPDHPGLCDEN